MNRGENAVAGSSERLGGNLFKWTAETGAPWYPQQRYEVTQINLEDLATTPNAVAFPSIDFTHIATFTDQTFVAYSKPDHSTPLAQSRYGLTSLFQGRTWHEELGLYYYRARWSSGEVGFIGRDPVKHSSQNPYKWIEFSANNFVDPSGLYAIDFHYYAVYYLAREADFSQDEAAQISWASQFVDDSATTRPYPGGGPLPLFWGSLESLPGRLYSFHFVSPEWHPVKRANPIAKLNLIRAERTGNLISLGIALHSWADTWAHEGFTGLLNPRGGIGHFFDLRYGIAGSVAISISRGGLYNQAPDQPYRAGEKALEAARTSYNFLESAAIARGRVPTWWSHIEKDVRTTFDVEGNEDARSLAWKTRIRLRFPNESFIYLEERAPASWIRSFNRHAKIQHRFVQSLRTGGAEFSGFGSAVEVVGQSIPSTSYGYPLAQRR